LSAIQGGFAEQLFKPAIEKDSDQQNSKNNDQPYQHPVNDRPLLGGKDIRPLGIHVGKLFLIVNPLAKSRQVFCSEARSLVAFTRLVDSSRFRFEGFLEPPATALEAACAFACAARALAELICDSSALCWAVSDIARDSAPCLAFQRSSCFW